MSQNKKDFENKKIKVNNALIGIPTYTELVQYAKEKQRLSHEEDVQSMKTEDIESIEKDHNVNNIEEEAQNMKEESVKNIEEQNDTIKLDVNKEISINNNSSMETLLIQLRKCEEEKQNLEQKNELLNVQITQLQTTVTKIRKDTQKEAEAIATNALRKVFTPGQISILLHHSQTYP